MTTATVNGTIVANSDETIVVEGNHYFPPASVNWDLFSETDRSSHCPWKGDASYFSLEVNGEALDNVAWTYHEPKEKATEIKDYVAFYPQVTVS